MLNGENNKSSDLLINKFPVKYCMKILQSGFKSVVSILKLQLYICKVSVCYCAIKNGYWRVFPLNFVSWLWITIQKVFLWLYCMLINRYYSYVLLCGP